MALHPIDRKAPYGGISSLVALKGIGVDKNLVHMSDEEIRDLEVIAGKPMSTNPETGLPQAFDFGNALASAAAIAATIYAPELSPMFFGASAPVLAGSAYGLTSLATHGFNNPGEAALGSLTTYGMGELGSMLGKDPSMAADTVGLPSVTEGLPGANQGLGAKILGGTDASGAFGDEVGGLVPGMNSVQPPPVSPDGYLYKVPPQSTSFQRLSNNVSNRVSDTGDAWKNAFNGETPMAPQSYTALKTSAPTEQGFFSGAKEGVTKGTSYTPQQLADRGYTQYSPSTLDRLANNKTAILGGIGQAYLGGSPDAPEPTKPIKRPAAPSYYGSKVAVGGKYKGGPDAPTALSIALGEEPNVQRITPTTFEDNPDYEDTQYAASGGLTGMMATGGAIRKMAQDLQKKGNGDDVLLAHINRKEAKMLKRAGGSGTVNPKTGLLQFEDDSSAGDWAGSAGADGEGGGGASSSGASSSDGGASSAGDWAGSAGADGMGGGGASMGGGASAGGSDTGNDGGASMDGMGNFGMGAPGGNTGFGPGSGLSGLDQSGLGPSGPSKQGNLGRSADDIDLEEADQNSKNAPPAAPWQDPDTPVSNYFQNLVANPLATAVNTGLTLGAMALNGTPFGAAASLASLGNTVSGVFGGPTAGSAMFGGPSTGTGGPSTAGQDNQNQQGNPNGPGIATADIGQSQSMAMAQAPSAPATGPQMGPGDGSSGVQPYYPPRVAQGGGLVSLATGGQAKAPQGRQYFEGQVEGNGDGMSDEVPFDIHNSNPNKALLSKDEYVLPADVVSMIGNGSSNAGSEEIDRFVAHIRKKAHGVSKQQTQLKGSKGLQSLVA